MTDRLTQNATRIEVVYNDIYHESSYPYSQPIAILKILKERGAKGVTLQKEKRRFKLVAIDGWIIKFTDFLDRDAFLYIEEKRT